MKNNSNQQAVLQISPIGYIRTSMQAKFDAPHQPDSQDHEASQGVVELLPDSRFYQALLDLDSFSHLWLIWWFDKNKTWRPKVLPPRGPEKRRGLFATRSPHRPNPLGLTAVKIISVTDNKIHIGNHDLIDGTPILDIKPYLSKVDSFPEASSGWIGQVEKTLATQPKFTIQLSDIANQQLLWLIARDVRIIDRAKQILTIDPSPHRTRRISKIADNKFRMGCGGWRIIYHLKNQTVIIDEFQSGYPLTTLWPERETKILHFAAHLEFHKVWKK